MKKYNFDDEFEYIEDEIEFEEFLLQEKKKKIILFSIISSVIISFIILICIVQNPYVDQNLTLQNDFDNIEIDDYYPEE